MKVVVVALAVLLLSGEALAGGAAWPKRRVPVWDFTPAAWQPFVAEQIRKFNAGMPDAAPRLTYHAMGERPCAEVRPYGRKGGISVCLETAERLGGNASDARYVTKEGAIVRGVLRLVETPPVGGPVCHELMHLFADAPDLKGADAERDSCVMGYRGEPGGWDAAFVRRTYRKHGRH